MRFLIIRTEVRPVAPEDVVASFLGEHRLRDESLAPELRRQVAEADSLEAALHLARALSSVGAVRTGKQRVKVLRVDTPRWLG